MSPKIYDTMWRVSGLTVCHARPGLMGKMNDLYMASCSAVAFSALRLPVLAEGMSLAATTVR